MCGKMKKDREDALCQGKNVILFPAVCISLIVHNEEGLIVVFC